MPRYRPTPAKRHASDDRKRLEESIRCAKHNVYFMTHMRMGGRIVRTVGCPHCHAERVALDAEAFAAAAERRAAAAAASGQADGT